MKIEVVLSYWDDGLFKLRDRIEADNTDSIQEEFELAVNRLVEFIDKEKAKHNAIFEDDDIPF